MYHAFCMQIFFHWFSIAIELITVTIYQHFIMSGQMKLRTMKGWNFLHLSFVESYIIYKFYVSVAAMTVGNGDTNGDSGHANGHTAAPVLEKGSWTVGLVNSRHKYLSAETFGFKINANGKTMKKKQVPDSWVVSDMQQLSPSLFVHDRSGFWSRMAMATVFAFAPTFTNISPWTSLEM